MLHCCVFLCGATLMIIELTGSRILAPFLGTSLIVWTSLIGVILASLSIGSWWGGILADRTPQARKLGHIVLLAAWATAAIGLSKTWILELLQGTGGLHTLAIASTVFLFAPASMLLGMVAPFAVRLHLKNHNVAGQTAGNLYAVSTIGSIAGTFAAGFVLIAWIGSTAILFVSAAILAFAAWLADPSEKAIKGVSALLFCLAIVFCLKQDSWLAARGFIDQDTPYNRVLVYTSKEEGTGRMTREMVTGPQGRQSSMYLDNATELALPYTRFYRLAEFYKPAMGRMLVLGGGGYSFPKYALANYPDVQIDVVELDPGITALARSHFALPEHPRLTVIEEDARTFLRQVQTKYDVILCDVFNSNYSIPFHMTTVEAVALMRAALNPGGLVLVNLLASPEGISSRFYKAFYATFQTAFPEVHAFAVINATGQQQWQNIILSALTQPPPQTAPADDEIKAMLTQLLPPPKDKLPPLTDEFAPVDRYLNDPLFHPSDASAP